MIIIWFYEFSLLDCPPGSGDALESACMRSYLAPVFCSGGSIFPWVGFPFFYFWFAVFILLMFSFTFSLCYAQCKPNSSDHRHVRRIKTPYDFERADCESCVSSAGAGRHRWCVANFSGMKIRTCLQYNSSAPSESSSSAADYHDEFCKYGQTYNFGECGKLEKEDQTAVVPKLESNCASVRALRIFVWFFYSYTK